MGSRGHITFLLGKPAKPDSMIAGVIERAHHHWPTIILHQPQPDLPLPESIFESDMIVQRGLSRDNLNTLQSLEDAGVRCINRITATIDCADRWALMSTLNAAGIPIPETRIIDTWHELLEYANGNPCVVKALDGEVGRGSGVLISADGVLPNSEPFSGPFIAQEYLAGNATVTKVYIAGNEMRGLVKRSMVAQEVDESFAALFEVSDELRKLSQSVAEALSLDIFGVDYLDGPMGPTVIDVNPFPGFRGIPDAVKIISRHILDEAREKV